MIIVQLFVLFENLYWSIHTELVIFLFDFQKINNLIQDKCWELKTMRSKLGKIKCCCPINFCCANYRPLFYFLCVRCLCFDKFCFVSRTLLFWMWFTAANVSRYSYHQLFTIWFPPQLRPPSISNTPKPRLPNFPKTQQLHLLTYSCRRTLPSIITNTNQLLNR